MDTQIWYAIFATIIGGIYGAFSHLGEVRYFSHLSDKIISLPSEISFIFFNAVFPNVDKNSWYAKGKIRICSLSFQQAPRSIFQG